MDANERHQLKENDLAHILEQSASKWNDREFWATWGNRILLVLLLISAVVLAYIWMNNRATAAREQMWSDLALAGSPETYDAVADSYANPTVKGLALLRSGDLLAQRAASGQTIMQGSEPASTQPATITSDPQADAKNAILRYNDVIALQGVSELIRLNAMLGKAGAHEDLAQWDEARDMYEQVQTQAGDAYPILTARAKNRLAMVPRLSEPVVFAPDAPAAVSDDVSSNSNVPAPLPGLGTLPMPSTTTPSPSQPQPEATTPAASDTPAAPESTETPAQ